MKIFVNIIVFICLLLVGTSCSQKKKSKLKLSISSITAAGINMPGGIMLYAHNNDTSEKISVNFQEGQNQVDLNNGSWDIFVMGWVGPNHMEGIVKCGGSSVSLNGGEETLAISITSAKCNNPLGETIKFIEADQFKNITIFSCSTMPVAPNTSTNCSGVEGSMLSYKILLLPNYSVGPGSPLVSECYELTSGVSSPSGLSLPFLSGASKPFYTVLEAFSGSGCTGSRDHFDFQEGFSESVSLFKENITSEYDFANDSADVKMFFKTSFSSGTPIISMTVPGDEDSSVAVNQDIVLTFDANIQQGVTGSGTKTFFIKKISDNSILYQYSLDDAETTIAGNTLTINPGTDLPGGEAVYVEVLGGALANMSAVDFPGISGNAILNFTTMVSLPVLEKKLSSDNAAGDLFGESVSISGSSVIVGASGDNSNEGSAYIYVYDISTNVWDETKIVASDSAVNDYFGQSVSISGTSAIVGAYGESSFAGAAYIYVYDLTTNNWIETKLIASDTAADDSFGESVAISGSTVIVGAPGDGDVGAFTGSAYIFAYNETANNWHETKIVASSQGASDFFGAKVAISGTSAIVGSHKNDDGGNNSGSAYIYVYDQYTNNWDETILNATTPAVDDFFGSSVSISGHSAIVGASGQDDNGADSGAVYIFTFDSANDLWRETKVTASDGGAGDKFGHSVSMSGFSAIVGAKTDDNGGGASSGSAYIYQYSTNTNSWDETKISASDASPSDFFGSSVSISGNLAVIGSYGDDDNGSLSGSLYIFDTLRKSGSTALDWSQHKLTASDPNSNDNFGSSVSISNNSVIIGTPLSDGIGTDSGSAYIYVYDVSTGIWDETKLVAVDAGHGDLYGHSVSISGTSAIVGAYADDDNGVQSGSAYIYVYDSSTSAWIETKVTASDGATLDHFGFNVSISGTSAIVGAYSDDDGGDATGSAYIYVYDTYTNVWIETKMNASDAVMGDHFGGSVSISGLTAIVGATKVDDSGASSGAVYIYAFDTSTDTWIETKLTASDAAAGDLFGKSVSISGNSVIVGAFNDDDAGTSSGSAYIFLYDKNLNTWKQHKVVASDAVAGDMFGVSVSISGLTAIVGAINNAGKGAAYIYSFETGTDLWKEKKLVSTDLFASDKFGSGVSISGNTAIVGAHMDDDISINSGSAYIFDLEY